MLARSLRTCHYKSPGWLHDFGFHHQNSPENLNTVINHDNWPGEPKTQSAPQLRNYAQATLQTVWSICQGFENTLWRGQTAWQKIPQSDKRVGRCLKNDRWHAAVTRSRKKLTPRCFIFKAPPERSRPRRNILVKVQLQIPAGGE